MLGRRCVVGALGALAFTGCFGDTTTDPDAGDTDASDAGDETGEASACGSTLGKRVGTEAQFPAGTWKLVGQIIVAQDTNGFFAFTGICTHQGCLVDPPASNGSTFCPCHGSRFDGNGNVIAGPATTPLRHFAVNVCGGDVYVNTSKTVTQATRTPPS